MLARLAILAAAGLCVNACATPGGLAVHQPAPGINEVLQGPLAAAPGHSLVVGDLLLGPAAPIARHYHSGEEFLYVLGGAVTISRPGQPDVTVEPGHGLRIPPGTVHWGRSGTLGLRAVASWVKVDGQPLRTPVPE